MNPLGLVALYYMVARQMETALTSHLKGQQLQLFTFVWQCDCHRTG